MVLFDYIMDHGRLIYLPYSLFIYPNSLGMLAHVFFRVSSLALGQSYDCPSASDVTLKNMSKFVFMWFIVLWLYNRFLWIDGSYLPVFFMVTSLVLEQSYGCPRASEVTLNNMGIIFWYLKLTKHQPYAYFLGVKWQKCLVPNNNDKQKYTNLYILVCILHWSTFAIPFQAIWAYFRYADFPGIQISIVNKRQVWKQLILIMRIPILAIWYCYMEVAPWFPYQKIVHLLCSTVMESQQDDCSDHHWGRWRQASTSPGMTKAVTLITFHFCKEAQ